MISKGRGGIDNNSLKKMKNSNNKQFLLKNQKNPNP